PPSKRYARARSQHITLSRPFAGRRRSGSIFRPSRNSRPSAAGPVSPTSWALTSRGFSPGGSGRTIYLFKLPRFEKKLRVALDWTLDLIFSKDLVQFLDVRAPLVSRPAAHLPRKSETPQLELSGPVS